jgi:hypothetical protein
MMACKWLLDRSPLLVGQLSRSKDPRAVQVGDNTRLKLAGALLEVPPKLDVYAVQRGFSKSREEYYFVCRNDISSIEAGVHLSYVKLDSDFELPASNRIGELLRFPWYDLVQSSLIFNRMIKNKELHHGVVFKDLQPTYHPHPLSFV